MNFNAIIATLELKGILTREEGEKLVEFINNKPQSTSLADQVDQIKELFDAVKPAETPKAVPEKTDTVKKDTEKTDTVKKDTDKPAKK